MEKLVLFDQFAKGKVDALSKTNNCVIYTRVSSKEQEEGHSLETQRKLCTEFAIKNSHAILGYFGGTYESAKTDERKEFNRMLLYVKKSKEKINYIIISHIDRFSRTGANAIYIKEQLKLTNVYLQAATTPVDPRSSIGDFQQNVQFIFSHYDNQVRKERTIMGTKQALLNGFWCGRQPFGYDIIKVNGESKIVINEKGKLIKKAFMWKASENLTLVEISNRLKTLGLICPDNRLSEYFRNPFYCGLMVHSCLAGQVVEGKHEKMISKDVFLKVNELMKGAKKGYTCNMDGETTPLRRFMCCDSCKKPMRGYIVLTKELPYYKCGTKGCKNNTNAKEIDRVFEKILRTFSLAPNKATEALIANQMAADYNKVNSEKEANFTAFKRQISEIDNKIERLEERVVLEEINNELFNKYSAKFKAEKALIELEMLKSGNEVSNLEKCVNLAMRLFAKLPTVWRLTPFKEKSLLQNVLFPEGIFYNKKKDQCRTTKINSVIRYFALLTGDWEAKKIGESKFFFDFPDCVPRAGLEPAQQ